MKFSIVIPLYNEQNNLTNLAKEINATLLNKYNYEIIFVDDFSQDESLITLLEISKKISLTIIKHDKNLGQSYSIFSGINKTKYDTIITLDADGQNNPKDIPKLLDLYFSDNKIALVGGIRFKRRDNFIKIFSSKVANKIRSVILNDHCPDTGCSLKIFDKKIFLSFPFFDGIHRFLPALFRGYGHKTVFIEVDHRSRKSGISKYGTFDRLFKGIYDLIRVKNIINKHKLND